MTENKRCKGAIVENKNKRRRHNSRKENSKCNVVNNNETNNKRNDKRSIIKKYNLGKIFDWRKTNYYARLENLHEQWVEIVKNSRIYFNPLFLGINACWLDKDCQLSLPAQLLLPGGQVQVGAEQE